jgi:hypothetical protein
MQLLVEVPNGTQYWLTEIPLESEQGQALLQRALSINRAAAEDLVRWEQGDPEALKLPSDELARRMGLPLPRVEIVLD